MSTGKIIFIPAVTEIKFEIAHDERLNKESIAIWAEKIKDYCKLDPTILEVTASIDGVGVDKFLFARMNKRYAVGYCDTFDNDLKLEIIEATDEREALKKHSKFAVTTELSLDEFPDMESIYEFLFNCDVIASVLEI